MKTAQKAGLTAVSGGGMKAAHLSAIRLLTAVIALVVQCVGATVSRAEEHALRGVALVIGNGAYEHLPALANPENDARAVEDTLNALGFDTRVSADRDAARLKRDLGRFAEDARDADVAVLYYSGHGIEAGGENFLVPVDADLSALDDAAGKLVPVSGLLRTLSAEVPVAIVMLDACRNSPFPDNATIRLAPGTAPVAVGPAGLTAERGAVSLAGDAGRPALAEDSLGTVIAFAAEPGKAALDGTAGGNSPYAAAVVRHLSAMAGEEFGLVMRMVAEEVYLRTGGKQRPWVNESMRRLLYFGATPPQPSGMDGDILRERRQLLITISDLPDPERRQVERVAAEGGVPMDALYGMLRTLGADTSGDPAKLEQALRGQTDRLKGILAERATLSESDAELALLTATARHAVEEGALATALQIHERIKARVAILSRSLEDTEAALRARHVEFAEAYARSGDSYALAFNHRQAAEDYGRAYEEVRRWDDALAWRYRFFQMNALVAHGQIRGDRAAIAQAVALAPETAALAQRLPTRSEWADTQQALGRALIALADYDLTTGSLQKAVAAFDAAAAVHTRESGPAVWAQMQFEIGQVQFSLAMRESSNHDLDAALQSYDRALTVLTREYDPYSWAWGHYFIGNAQAMMGTRGGGTQALEKALAAYRAALSVITRAQYPVDWSSMQFSYAFALGRMGMLTGGTAYLTQSADAFEDVVDAVSRDNFPLAWAESKSRLAEAWSFLGERTGDIATLDNAYDAFTQALAEQTRERTPFNWAATLGNRATVLSLQGELQRDPVKLERAIADYALAEEVIRRDVSPLVWATVQTKLGRALGALARLRGDKGMAVRAVEAHLSAIDIRNADSLPLDRADAQHNLGIVMLDLAESEPGGPWIDYALNAFDGAMALQSAQTVPQLWAESSRLLARAKILDGERRNDRAPLQEAIALLRGSAAYFAASGFHRYDGYVSDNLARAETDLARLK